MPPSGDTSKTNPTQPTHSAGSLFLQRRQHQPVSKPPGGRFPQARTAGWAGKAGSNGNRPPPPQQRPSWPTEQAELTHPSVFLSYPIRIPAVFHSVSLLYGPIAVCTYVVFRVTEQYPSRQAGRQVGRYACRRSHIQTTPPPTALPYHSQPPLRSLLLDLYSPAS